MLQWSAQRQVLYSINCCFKLKVNKLRGRRVRPTRYTPARVQEPNFTALELDVTVDSA